MAGCRALTDEEVRTVAEALRKNRYSTRDRCLFLVGLFTGFRISELLSLRLKDVVQEGVFLSTISVARKHMKKKVQGRTVVLHPQAKEAIAEWVSGLSTKDPGTFLFLSRQGSNRPITRKMAWAIMRKAARASGLLGRVAPHSMRKTFAKDVHESFGHDLVKTQKALGHASVTSTIAYLSVDDKEIDDAVLNLRVRKL